MSKSFELLMAALREFDEPGFSEDHEELNIELPQVFLRYNDVRDSGGMTDNLSVSVKYLDKELAFSVKISDRSMIRTVVVVEAGSPEDGRQRFCINRAGQLLLKDGEKLFFWLLEHYACFKVSVTTLRRNCW